MAMFAFVALVAAIYVSGSDAKGCLTHQQVADFMIGTWDVKFTTGHGYSYIISNGGKIVAPGTNYHAKKSSFLSKSQDQKSFPTAGGWVMAGGTTRAGMWEFYKAKSNGQVELHHFCKDSKGCNKKYNGVSPYYFTSAVMTRRAAKATKSHAAIVASLVGTWDLVYGTGFKTTYTILPGGKVKWGTRVSHLSPSQDKAFFPASQGWVMAGGVTRKAMWEFFRLQPNGQLRVEHFCKDGCKSKFIGAKVYYYCGAIGTKRRAGDETAPEKEDFEQDEQDEPEMTNDEEPEEDEAVEDEAVEDEPVEDETVEDEAVEDEPVEDEPVEDETVEDEDVEDEPVEDEDVEDEPVEDEAVEDEPVEDEPVEDEAVEDETEEDEAVEDEA